MHGVTMIFLFVIPISTGAFGNYLLPLMIGARDMAFPRMNALSFWIFLASGLFMYTALVIGSAPDAGWFNYVPLRRTRSSARARTSTSTASGSIFNGISTTAAAINFIVTIFKLRAPGMSLNRMPLFCFAFLAVSFALVFALPPLTVARRPARARPPDRHPLLRHRGRRRPGAVAAPVLDLRPPRGLHHHPARVRDRDVDHPDLRAAAGWSRSRSSRWPRSSSRSSASASGRTTCSPSGWPTATTVYFAAASLIIVIPSAIQLFAWLTTLVDRHARLPDAAAVDRRLHRLLHRRRAVGRDVRRHPVRPAGDRHLLRRRPLPLRDLRRGGVPAARRDVLLVPEGHRAGCTTRASGKLSFWLPFAGTARDVLPDAHRRAAGDAAARSTPTPPASAGPAGTCSRRSAPTCSAAGLLLVP